MPELPEVQTTVNGINSNLIGLSIKDVWSDYSSPYFKGKDQIKNVSYFKTFKKNIVGEKILKAERLAKNILIHLSNEKIILIHMKMTGHLMYGNYKKITEKSKDMWKTTEKGALSSPFNGFIHFVLVFNNKKQLVLSDMRKFAKITLIDKNKLLKSIHLKNLGPEPLEKNFDLKKFIECLNKKPKGKIKTVLMDQSIISGIGNIYSDEILWKSGVHPESIVKNIPKEKFTSMFKAIKILLKKGIQFGGDSMSDYRNIYGEKGKFQLHHEAYKRKGELCRKKGCKGLIERKLIGGRSAHFCQTHQIKY